MNLACVERLRPILGKAVDECTEGELAVALRVLDWFSYQREMDNARRGVDATALMKAEAIRRAVQVVTGASWDEIRARGKVKKLVDYRYAAAYLLYETSKVPKGMIGYVLDLNRDRTTVVYGLKVCRDWVLYDANFRRLYTGLKDAMERVLADMKNDGEEFND